MTRRLLAGTLLLAAAAAARAETADADAVTLGALAERADAVVVAEAQEVPPAREAAAARAFRVVEVLRGAGLPAVVEVDFPARDGARPDARPDSAWLLFLRRAAGGRFECEGAPYAARAAAEPGVRALVDYTRRYAAALAPDGAIGRPAELTQLLVESLASPESGVPSCAGRDLARHAELVAAMTPAQRQAVDAALVRPRRADGDLRSVVIAAGVAGTEACEPALVGRLLDPASRHLRIEIVQALGRRARPETAALLAARLDGATPVQRADLANALGRLARREAEPHLLRLLRDPEVAVRIEAAHSTGLLARDVRRAGPGVEPSAAQERLGAAAPALTAVVGAAATRNERKAALWALAQVDTPEAWGALKRLRDEAGDPQVREIAGEYLLRPRVSLVLDP